MSNSTKKTPYFVFKPKLLEKNYKEFEKLCKKYLKKYVIAYSVKTNSFDEVIECLDKLGSGFEVASFDEIETINKVFGIEVEKEKQSTIQSKNKKLIVNNKKENNIVNNKQKFIVFNGCCKTDEELETAIKNSFLINADSLSEIDKIRRILNGNRVDIGLRISLEENKFGFELEKLEEIIDYCKKNNLEITCLSFHGGTKLNINSYKKLIENVDNIVSGIKNKVKLKYIDLGGGFPDNFQLKNLGVCLEDYFKLINKLKKFNIIIILEPGRFLVSDAFNLITKVNVIKQNFGKNYAILDAGINVLSKITLASYKFSKIENISNINFNNNFKIDIEIEYNLIERGSSFPGMNSKVNSELIKNKEKKEYILAGPILFKNDVLGKFFGNLEENDLIKIENVGAYCYNLGWEISYKKPRILVKEFDKK